MTAPDGHKATILRGRDLHVHFRQGAMARTVLPFTARQFDGAIAMPNTQPVIATVGKARSYRGELSEIADGLRRDGAIEAFDLMMTLYLTDRTAPADIAEAASSDFVVAAKYYPSQGTTNSDEAASSVAALWKVFEAMEKEGLVLSVHGEDMAADVEVLDREARFIDRHLGRIVDAFPGLRIVFEHATTRAAVEFVRAAPDNVAATITPQHLLFTLDHLLGGLLDRDLFCKPVVKRRADRAALVEVAVSGDPKFFAGTDSAPHARAAKDCGCAGCFTAPIALELYAEAFDADAGLERPETRSAFQRFIAENGAAFYGFALTGRTVTLEKAAAPVPREVGLSNSTEAVTPLCGAFAEAEALVNWRMVD